ncbi:MAG TPA: SRPBCC family protein [Kofleriaceae bacterium]|nr:SRPBCC family protein [Kofleriaceae bacterium]
MTKPSSHHDTFVIERIFKAPIARVFAAWADPAFKRKWFIGPDEWTRSPHRLDFKVGGKESIAGGPAEGPLHRYEAVYHDIVANHRVVSTYDMYLDDVRISVSLATVELFADGAATRLVYTEQAVYLDGYDDAGERERGTRGLFDQLAAALAAA